jgi:hypothetical protein
MELLGPDFNTGFEDKMERIITELRKSTEKVIQVEEILDYIVKDNESTSIM